MTEIVQPIPARLKNVAVDGHVAGASDIMDDSLNKTQDVINAEVAEAIGTGGSVDSRIAAAINALDSSKSQSAGADGLALNIVEENGKITSISGSIASNTYDAYGAASSEATRAQNAESALSGRVTTLETAVGSGGSVDSRIAAAKAEVKGNATSACDTLGEAETKINANTSAINTESSRAQAAESNLQQLYEALTQSDIEVVDAVPASGVANKIYRVVGETSYSDYMFNSSDLNTPIKMAEYDNAIDDVPTAGSNNLVKSGGTKAALNQIAKSIISKEAKNILITDAPLVAGSYYRLIVWAESTIECTQFSIFTPFGIHGERDITSYDGTPIIIEGTVSETSVDGEIFVWISNNQSVGTKIYCKLDSFESYNVISIAEINKVLLSTDVTIESGKKRCVTTVNPLAQSSGAIVHVESPVDIVRINFIENTSTWTILDKITGKNIKDKIFLMPAGCTYIQIDTTENVQEDTDVHFSILYGGLYDDLYQNIERLSQAADISNEEITRNVIAIPCINPENVFSNKVDFIEGYTYKISIWSDTAISCTQFSLLTSLGDVINSGIVSYDGTPIVLVKKATSTIRNGHIKAWVSNNQNVGTIIYCRMELVSTPEVEEQIDQIRGKVLLDTDATIQAGSKRFYSFVTALQSDTPATVYIYGTDKIVHINLVESVATWRTLGTIDANPITRKSFIMPAGCHYIQFDTAHNLTEGIDFHILIVYGDSLLQLMNEDMDSGVGASSIINRNQDKIPTLYSMCRYNGLGHTSNQPANTRPFQDAEFLLVADHHRDSLALNNAVDLLNGIDCIDALIHCGDFGGAIYSPTTGADMYNILKRANKPYLAVIGNHDVGTSIVIEQCCDHATAYNDYIKPLVDNAMLAVGEYEDGKCYYYHDFTERKLRMIFLYEYDDPMEIDETIWKTIPYDASIPLIGVNGTSYVTGDQVRLENYTTYCFEAKQNVTLSIVNNWSDTTRPAYKIPRGVRVIRQEQAEWFLGVLASTPEGYDVMVVTHMPFSYYCSKVNCDFSISLNVKGEVTTILDDFIADAVNAYANRANFSKTVQVSALWSMPGFSYDVACDFTQAKGNFIGFIGGHNHYDLVLKHQAYNLYGVYPTAAKTWSYNENDYREDIAHSNSDGVAYDCLTVISPASDRIMLAKIGATKTIDGRTREYQLLDQNA